MKKYEATSWFLDDKCRAIEPSNCGLIYVDHSVTFSGLIINPIDQYISCLSLRTFFSSPYRLCNISRLMNTKRLGSFVLLPPGLR